MKKHIDDLDQRLLAELKRDARVPVTCLAAQLCVSRATVKARMENLKHSGVIRRFTVETDELASETDVRAVMLLELESACARQVTRALRQIPEIVTLHGTNGVWDLVGEISAASLADFDRILSEVGEIKGVLNSETFLLLKPA